MSEENIENPSFAKVIKDAVENRLIDVHTCLPGTIISYDSSKQKASVQPNIQRKMLNGVVQDLPIINSVPVVHPRSGKAAILLPLKAGDPCLLIFAERSIDLWKSKGGQVDPQDTRKHDLSDAFCIPGGSAFPMALAGDPSDLVMVNDKAEVRLKSSGKISVKNLATGDELVDLNHQMAMTLSEDTVNTIFGPMQLNSFSTYATIASKIANIKV